MTSQSQPFLGGRSVGLSHQISATKPGTRISVLGPRHFDLISVLVPKDQSRPSLLSAQVAQGVKRQKQSQGNNEQTGHSW